jgi:hypothetical protein
LNGRWRRPEGNFINPYERGEIGSDLFRAACNMGLESDATVPIRPAGQIKVKNRKTG